MTQLFQTLWQLVQVLFDLAIELLALGLHWSLLLFWVAWWLLAVNWKRGWSNLAHGAWMPLVLIVVMAAYVWSQIVPSDCGCLGFTTVPNFYWQLGATSLLTAVALICGWLQDVLGWTPPELNLNPPAEAHGHDHGHGHGHH